MFYFLILIYEKHAEFIYEKVFVVNLLVTFIEANDAVRIKTIHLLM
jgi:hypothetical protein